MEKRILCGMSPGDLTDFFGSYGLTMEHALKITNSLYKKGSVSSAILKGVPARLMELIMTGSETGLYDPVSSEISADGTIKYLFINSSGSKFETVFIPEQRRTTLCVSSQSGCRMGCPFCVTGRYGFHGNLGVSDIVNQLLSLPGYRSVTHIVFMGMGEPMDNLENVLRACEVFSAEWGCSISRRNITVSSIGITPRVSEFLERSDCNLAISLFSPFFDERRRLVPIESKWPVEEIINIVKAYPSGRKRRMTLSYVMIEGINDSDRHLEELIKLLSGSGIRINLLPYHRLPGDNYISSSPEKMQYFKHSLMSEGISASVRKSRGEDISAACGLLASGITGA